MYHYTFKIGELKKEISGKIFDLLKIKKTINIWDNVTPLYSTQLPYIVHENNVYYIISLEYEDGSIVLTGICNTDKVSDVIIDMFDFEVLDITNLCRLIDEIENFLNSKI